MPALGSRCPRFERPFLRFQPAGWDAKGVQMSSAPGDVSRGGAWPGPSANLLFSLALFPLAERVGSIGPLHEFLAGRSIEVGVFKVLLIKLDAVDLSHHVDHRRHTFPEAIERALRTIQSRLLTVYKDPDPLRVPIVR